MGKKFLVALVTQQGVQHYPMKEWLREHPDVVPPGLDASRSISHALRDGLRRAGWRVSELETEVHMIPPDGFAVPPTKLMSISNPDANPATMGSCFVIQPFDNGRFDKRYEDIFKPAITAAGMKPYRVDQDDASLIPIENIEAGIRVADACFAEITTDNPNVWFELGFAIAAGKPVVMVCADERAKFPFDVQHRSIIRYQSEAPRDFEDLKRKITGRLRAAMEAQRKVTLDDEQAGVGAAQGLAQREIVALIAIATPPNYDLSPKPFVRSIHLQQQLTRAGFTAVSCVAALRVLERKEYIQAKTSSLGYPGWIVTDGGLDWLADHHDTVS